jgi:hypothetical protein
MRLTDEKYLRELATEADEAHQDKVQRLRDISNDAYQQAFREANHLFGELDSQGNVVRWYRDDALFKSYKESLATRRK